MNEILTHYNNMQKTPTTTGEAVQSELATQINAELSVAEASASKAQAALDLELPDPIMSLDEIEELINSNKLKESGEATCISRPD